MAGNPEPGEFLSRMFRELFDQVPKERSSSGEPSKDAQRENLAFALATRATEALEDVALNVAAIRQRLERMDEMSREALSEARRQFNSSMQRLNKAEGGDEERPSGLWND